MAGNDEVFGERELHVFRHMQRGLRQRLVEFDHQRLIIDETAYRAFAVQFAGKGLEIHIHETVAADHADRSSMFDHRQRQQLGIVGSQKQFCHLCHRALG